MLYISPIIGGMMPELHSYVQISSGGYGLYKPELKVVSQLPVYRERRRLWWLIKSQV